MTSRARWFRPPTTGGSAGRIILINGTSSSGKSALVRELQGSVPDLWIEMGIDRFAYALPGRVAGQPTWPQLFRYVRPDGRADGPFTIETTPRGQLFIASIHRTAAAIAAVGLNVIVDHVLLERGWLDDCARVWSPFSVLFVGVRCPLDVVVRREQERTDRTIGQAEAQFGLVHRWGGYDVEVDTSVVSPAEAAATVRAALETAPPGGSEPPPSARRHDRRPPAPGSQEGATLPGYSPSRSCRSTRSSRV